MVKDHTFQHILIRSVRIPKQSLSGTFLTMHLFTWSVSPSIQTALQDGSDSRWDGKERSLPTLENRRSLHGCPPPQHSCISMTLPPVKASSQLLRYILPVYVHILRSEDFPCESFSDEFSFFFKLLTTYLDRELESSQEKKKENTTPDTKLTRGRSEEKKWYFHHMLQRKTTLYF